MVNTIELTKQLVRINSVSGNELSIQQFIFDLLSSKGFKPQLQYVFDNRPNVVCTAGEGKKHILLNSHVDTVNVCKGWTSDPFEPHEHGDKIIGLGAADQKAGVAIHLEHFMNGTFEGKATIACVVDEEVFSAGTHHLLSNNRISADAALFSEPSFSGKLDVNNAVPGRFAFDVSIHGKSAHGATMEGINAIVEAAKAIVEIQKIQLKPHAVMGTGLISIGSIRAGNEFLSVPETCTFRVDRSTVAGESMESVLAELHGAIAHAKIRSKVTISPIERPTPPIPAGMTSTDTHLMQVVKKVFDESKVPFTTGKLDSTFDMGYTIKAGIPSVCIGPVGANLHGADEYVLKSSIEQCSKIYGSILKNL